MKKIVSVIIPAYNEEKRIENTLLTLNKINIINNVYVIDDGSTDNTYANANSIPNIKTIRIYPNQGKGYALYKGVELVLDKSDIIVFLDADLEESAKEVEKLIYPILENRADVTIAKFPAAKHKGGFGFVKKLAREGVYINTGIKIDTTLSGQRAFKKSVLQEINKVYGGYGIELGMTIDILNEGYNILEVDVNMCHNETGRDLSGFIHRGKQFWQILIVLFPKTISNKFRRR